MVVFCIFFFFSKSAVVKSDSLSYVYITLQVFTEIIFYINFNYIFYKELKYDAYKKLDLFLRGKYSKMLLRERSFQLKENEKSLCYYE